ncbi:hypothetical protein C1H46_004552 [Malus baccata]|uniref:Pentatricopeptide repeat-containing protein n=1 Tax=Malus baccata TaxID=106549 RepID=A0A540NFI1_MALBA|nr:hypothetical protein C1H46_004552 [Malus baccata]
MIRGFIDNGLYNKAIALYSKMWDVGGRPDHFTFPFVIKACGFARDWRLGKKVHGDVIECRYALDVFVGNSLIGLYGKFGQVETAWKGWKFGKVIHLKRTHPHPEPTHTIATPPRLPIPITNPPQKFYPTNAVPNPNVEREREREMQKEVDSSGVARVAFWDDRRNKLRRM